MSTAPEFHTRLQLPDSHTPEPQLPERWLTLCERQSIVALTGPDARRFLQGQVTCDLNNLPDHCSVLGAACTPKGRAYINFRVLADADRLLLRMPRELVEPTLTHWRKYLAFFKAEVHQLDGWSVLGMGGHWPESGVVNGQARPHLEGFVVGVPPMGQDQPRHELWLPNLALDRLDLETFQRLCPEAWHLSEIRAGILNLFPSLVEQYVPQVFNWHSLEGISFKKGCYTGQEIIARMHYLGQLKKSLFRVTLDKPVEGSLPATVTQNGKNAGEIVDQVALADGSAEGLAVLRHGLEQNAPLIAEADTLVALQPLPYEVAEQKVTNS